MTLLKLITALAVLASLTACNIDALTDNETFNSNSGNTTQTSTTTTTTTNTSDSNNDTTFLEAGLDPDTGEPIPTGL